MKDKNELQKQRQLLYNIVSKIYQKADEQFFNYWITDLINERKALLNCESKVFGSSFSFIMERVSEIDNTLDPRFIQLNYFVHKQLLSWRKTRTYFLPIVPPMRDTNINWHSYFGLYNSKEIE